MAVTLARFIKAENNSPYKARNAADSADVELFKLNTSDQFYMLQQPKFTGTASAADDLVNKGKLDTDLALYIPLTQKGAASGVVPLNASSLIDSVYLPSYVDDVLEYADLGSFPGTGEVAKIYVALDTGKIYRWSGSAYIEIVATPGTTDSVTEGVTNLYFTEPRVRATVLTGLSTATGGAVSATDSILVAFGRLENRMALNDAKVSYSAATARADVIASSIVDGDTTHAPDGNSVFDALALKSDVGHTHVAADVTDFNAAARAAARYGLENLLLSGTDISNGYKDLAQVVLDGSELIWPLGGPLQTKTTDYSLNLTGGAGGKTRVTFAGDLASLLISGDRLQVSYMY